MFGRKVMTAIILSVLPELIAGCQWGQDRQATGEITETIRIMYDNEDSFNRLYGMLFASQYPDIEAEIVPGSRPRSRWARVYPREKRITKMNGIEILRRSYAEIV